jgi:small-conductance mechanosensitive channel
VLFAQHLNSSAPVIMLLVVRPSFLFVVPPGAARGTLPAEPGFRELGQSWHADIVDFVRHDALKIIIILLLSFVLQRIVTFFVKRMRRLANVYASSNVQRASQLRTIASILRATSYGLIGFIALLQILPLFNIDLKPLLASAGVVGLGISFGAQSLFKDMLNGIFILIEDQFNVGDVVRVASLTGTVEDLSLRATTLRDGDGTQHFIPNSQIATVSNLSRQYSVASLPVSVDASADPDRVMALLLQIATEVRRDPAFANIAIADPDILGVDKINGREVIYPVNVKVQANQKDGILRAIRRKILLTFEKEGIPLGTPTSTVVMQGHDPTAPPAQSPLIGG